MYNLFSLPSFNKAITRYQNDERKRIDVKIVDLQIDPYLGKRMSGKVSDILSLRVGDERVYYRVCENCWEREDYKIWQCFDCDDREDNSVVLFNVGHKGDILQQELQARIRKSKKKPKKKLKKKSQKKSRK